MSDRLAEPLGPEDHVMGPDGADLELVMYGDFECPFCAAAQPILARVRTRLGARLRFAYRHFPIEERHPHALGAAQAAEAAGAQGAFWAMHDALFAAPGRLEHDDLVAHAHDIGLDADRVAAELAAGAHVPRVRRDQASGVAGGVTGTPGFFANGVRVTGAFDAGSLVEALTSDA
jgi:protein-disulfide isomerase